MSKPAILLFHGRGLISTAIRLQTRSQYSHAALHLPDDSIVESWQGDGVRQKTLADWEGIDRFEVPIISDFRWKIIIGYALAQVGKGYDYQGVARFITRASMKENDRWFCSELVFAACKFAGVPLLERIEPWAVSPGHLALSPFLIPSPRIA